MPILNCYDEQLYKKFYEMNQEVANGELTITFPWFDGPLRTGLTIKLVHPEKPSVFCHAVDIHEYPDDKVFEALKPLLKEWYPRAKASLRAYDNGEIQELHFLVGKIMSKFTFIALFAGC